MITSTSLRRAAVAVAGAALLTVGATAATAADPEPGVPGQQSGPDHALVNPATPPGSEAQFVAVAPCRIIDTRKSGGALVAGQRTFDATMANYSTQGGKAGTCTIPDVATAVQLNLGAISQNNKTSDIKGWATGTTEPTASLVNYNPSGPVANMVTMPVNTSGQFNLKTPGAAHIFADVAGYYVKPLYVMIDSSDGSPAVVNGIASGFVSVARSGAGAYTVTFNRNVTNCSPAATDFLFTPIHEISVDSKFSGDSTVYVQVKNSSTGAADDSMFYLSLTC